MSMPIRDIQRLVPDCRYQVDIPVSSTKSNLAQFKVSLNPEYQRGHVWTREQQEKYVGALLEMPESMCSIILNDCNPSKGSIPVGTSEVVDGKQRLTAIVAWLDGEIDAACPCGERVVFSSLDEIDRRVVGISTCLRWKWVKLDRVEVMRYYLRLNDGGTIHSHEELDRVRGLVDAAEKERA